MKIAPVRDYSLPPLSWCARLMRDDTQLTVLMGGGVETFADQGFFEGAWAGEFGAAGFDSSAAVFGSGAVVRGQGVTFVTPSHTCERLHLARLRDADGREEIVVSNSLCALLAATGMRLDPALPRYASIFTGVIRGIDRLPQFVPTISHGGTASALRLIHFRNLHMTRGLDVDVLDKADPYSFPTFGAYESTITQTLQQVVSNAADPARASRYAPLTSISSGYDSPACATLAKRAGCDRAVTLTHARRNRRGVVTDSGGPIADALGMMVREFLPWDLASIQGTPEAEFLATGMSGEDVSLLPFESELRSSIFFTGFSGDKMWGKNTHPDTVLERADLNGCSLNEFRLRTNFIHVPVPFIGGLRHPQLHAISTSVEMRPWSVGGAYDRPIARRLVEEAGVPRHLFGQRKKATASRIHLRGAEAMSPGTRGEIGRHLAKLALPSSATLRFRADALLDRAGFVVRRVLRKARLLTFIPPLTHRVFAIHSHTPLGPVPMVWAMNRIIEERYGGVRRDNW